MPIATENMNTTQIPLTPNPSFKRTRHIGPRLAFISFSAKLVPLRRSA